MSKLLHGAAAAVLALAWYAAGAEPAHPPPDGRDAFDVVFLDESRPVLMRLHVHLNGKPLQAAWDAFVDRLFRHLDANRDGVLSRAEARKVPAPSLLLYGSGGESVPFAALDANRDGKVTRQELAHYYRTHGAAPLDVRFGSRNNGYSGTLRFAFAGQFDQQAPQDVNRRLFDLLDANKDGKLSREELAAGPARLARLDANDDEMITPEELNPAHVPDDGNDGGANAVFFFASDAAMPAPGAGPFLQVRPGEPSKELGRRLLQQYGAAGKGPAPTRLGRKDLGLDEATFARLDADGDGMLDAEELARFAQRPPDLELIVRAGTTGANEPRMEVVRRRGADSPLAAHVHPSPRGGLRLDLGVSQVELGDAFAAGMAGNIRVTSVNSRDAIKMQFREADTDKNGYLDRAEAMRSPAFRGLFDQMDRDGDGKLYEKEVFAYLDATKDLQEAAAAGRVVLQAQSHGSGLFDLLDTNHDGRLSVRELRHMGKLIAQLDRDGDGMISRGEVPRTYGLSFHPAEAGAMVLGGTFAVAINASAASTPVAEPTRGPLWFRKMDRNRDGDVSRREFLGTDADFRRIDTDGDGLISVEEAIAADKWFRKKK
jgi:Ca2+-binding EF-hand superfamily protein